MCCFKSVIILKDDIFVPDYNSHTAMLTELGIKDTKENAEKLFVRAELLPPKNDVFVPVARWHFHVDQDILPDWFIQEIDEKRVQRAVEKWVKKHCFINEKDLFFSDSGEYYVKDCNVIAGGTATIYAYGESKVQARDRSTILAYNTSTVRAYDYSNVSAFYDTKITSYMSAHVHGYDRAEVDCYDSSSVVASNDSKITAYDHSRIQAYNRSEINVFGDSMVESFGTSKIEAHNASIVKVYALSMATAFNNATIILVQSPLFLIEDSKKNFQLHGNATLINLNEATVIRANEYNEKGENT